MEVKVGSWISAVSVVQAWKEEKAHPAGDEMDQYQLEYNVDQRSNFHQSTNQISGVVAEWLSRKTRNLVPSGA
jgi:hypothetical protein